MEQSNVDLFLSVNSNKFPQNKIMLVRDLLLQASPEKDIVINTVQLQDPVLLLIISLFFGSLGIDRFMLGQVGLGIFKLITFGGLGFWTLIDWFIIMGKTKERNFNKFMSALA
ncbi:MAG: TM2 domain-containing protein [Rikenellaceae bacterium]|nr:TM2 domain-containing protein [Rikenellaceae bacterium]